MSTSNEWRWRATMTRLLGMRKYNRQWARYFSDVQSFTARYCGIILRNCFCRETSLGQFDRGISHRCGALLRSVGQKERYAVDEQKEDRNGTGDDKV
ncbi:hypothetical protein WN944_015028 [Citrus x changshan-huyou]|uniref:Uncharacterized protein n=1 Tax=Citrus x changshan-huyou TaxID=2935761 RepID=A0AAP0QM97_9ROSI